MHPIAPLALACVLATTAAAQSVYVDCHAGNAASTPSSTYRAAAGAPGFWNPLAHATGTTVLRDRAGLLTNVRAQVHATCAPAACDDTSITGDDAALLEDWWTNGCDESGAVLDIVGLASGEYDLYFYYYDACSPWFSFDSHIALVVGGSTVVSGVATLGLVGPFTGSFTNFSYHHLHVSSLPSACTLHVQFSTSGPGGLAGFQIVSHADDMRMFCSGSNGNCPCADGGPTNGCPSSFSGIGARLTGSGSPALGSDSLLLVAQNVGSSVVTFVQGTGPQNLGMGFPFGDGLSCTAGTFVRIAERSATNGVARYPAQGDQPVSIVGAVPAGGGSRTYQALYRDPAPSFCTPSVSNSTNGLAVIWR